MYLKIPAREPLPADLLSDPLPIERVLYEAEAPIVYVSRTRHGQLLLAYLADESSDGVFTLLAPASEERLVALTRGLLTVREALTSSWLWLHVADSKQGRLWTASLDEIPEDCLPSPGTPLLPEHAAVLRTRAIGEQVSLGRMPASVIAFVADATRHAVKTLLDYTSATPSEGRPREEHRAMYDLPVQRVAFSSFEVSFGAPDEGLFPGHEIRRAAEKLEAGLAWAGSAKDDPLPATTDEERAAVLRAALLLTPPTAGPISEVQISGSWIRCGTIRLTRDSRRKVRQELRVLDSEQVVTCRGRIGELDVDNLSLILRDSDDNRDHRGVFGEELLDDMLQLFSESARVAIAGVERRGRLYIAAIAAERAAGA